MTRAELEDERSFLLDSLEDLERERVAGDLSKEDYEVLRDRYTRRAAEVLHALERTPRTLALRGGPLDPSASRPVAESSVDPSHAEAAASVPEVGPRRVRRRRTLLVAGSLAMLAAVAIAVVAGQTGARLPGQTATGSVSLSPGEQLRRTLAQAETLESSGNASGALRLYLQVLGQHPIQLVVEEEALAQSGWLEYEAGVSSSNPTVLAEAQTQEQAAQRADPGAYAPHLYLGSMLLAEGNASGAVGQYRQFLADHPPAAEVRAAQSFITEAFTKAGDPVPAMPG